MHTKKPRLLTNCLSGLTKNVNFLDVLDNMGNNLEQRVASFKLNEQAATATSADEHVSKPELTEPQGSRLGPSFPTAFRMACMTRCRALLPSTRLNRNQNCIEVYWIDPRQLSIDLAFLFHRRSVGCDAVGGKCFRLTKFRLSLDAVDKSILLLICCSIRDWQPNNKT